MQRSKHNDRRSRQPGGLRRPLQYEKERGDRRQMWKKDEGERENSERCRSLYLGESGGWGDAGRLARRGDAKPDGAALGLEAGKGAHFTRTQIILKIKY